MTPTRVLYRSITQSYYRNSVGVILLYDITQSSTFRNLQDWLMEVRNFIEANSAVFMVIACKSDLEADRQVMPEQGKAFADYYSMHFFESSAKTGHNVEEPFHYITQQIYDRVATGEFRVEEGWEGIKLGFAQPQTQNPIPHGEPVPTCC
ncbi:RAB39B [Cordylochernes scorpioides]|uniref:RAB39B n=1 Tax=Cordylochernes scorpioides TaxID=51811 RepID=A0ABY6LTS3_9ARAC|nr:RAB39B [Cordylochernes scorpioides]